MRSENRMRLTGFCSLASRLRLAKTIAVTVPVGAGSAVAKISRRRNVMRRIRAISPEPCLLSAID